MRRLLLLLCATAAPLTAAPSLIAPVEAPVEGQPMVLSFRDDGVPATGVSVTAVYRENAYAALRHEQSVGTTDGEGRVEWTPSSAGVVVLKWEGGAQNLSVVHDGPPVAGVVIALFAGLALIGGSVLFFVQMLRQPEPEIMADVEEVGEPPST